MAPSVIPLIRPLISTLVLLALLPPLSAQYVVPQKASHRATLAEYREQTQADRAAHGPLPYPPGYRVAFADKSPQRERSLATQTPLRGREALALPAQHPDLLIVDLRTAEEFADEHIPGAISVPFAQPHQGFIRDLAELDSNRPTLLYCDTGDFTAKARLGFGVYGFETLYPLRDGLRGWKAAGGPTVGPREGLSHGLDTIPPLATPDYRPTPAAQSPDEIPNGPFPVIPVSNDFAMACDFAFDGHGTLTSSIITFLIRKRADVVGKPFRTIPDARYPKEHVKNWNGIRLFHGDIGGRDQIRYRADGTLLRPYFPARGKPSVVRVLHHEVREKRGEKQVVIEKEERWQGEGFFGVHTDRFHNIWFSRYEPWTRDPETRGTQPPALVLVTPDDEMITLLEGGPLEMPFGLVHDARRNLLFFTEPLKQQIWALPVDRHGDGIGEPHLVAELADSEPWCLALDEFGQLYIAAEPNVLRFRLDEAGHTTGPPTVMNATPIPRAHAVRFGHGAGFHERSLYVMSTPETWQLVADALTGYVLGTRRADGTVSRQLENVRALMSPLVRLDLGVRGAPETLFQIERFAPDNYPEGFVETIEAKRKKTAF